MIGSETETKSAANCRLTCSRDPLSFNISRVELSLRTAEGGCAATTAASATKQNPAFMTGFYPVLT